MESGVLEGDTQTGQCGGGSRTVQGGAPGQCRGGLQDSAGGGSRTGLGSTAVESCY